MTYRITRSDDEIDAVLNIASEHDDRGIKSYPGMTFEQGVARGIEWVTGLGENEAPLP